MNAASLREFVEREPFRPFRVRLTSGDSYVIRNPGLVVVMRSEVFIALPGIDRWTVVPLPHIAAAEVVGNGQPRRKRQR